jgi:hypothetical protein
MDKKQHEIFRFIEFVSINEKMGISNDALLVYDKIMKSIKENPKSLLYHINFQDMKFSVVYNSPHYSGNYFDSEMSKNNGRICLHLHASKSNDAKVSLRNVLIHEITHGIEWFNKNNKSYGEKSLTGNWKNIEVEKKSSLAYILYRLSPHELKALVHEFYVQFKSDVRGYKRDKGEPDPTRLKNIVKRTLEAHNKFDYKIYQKKFNGVKDVINKNNFNENTTVNGFQLGKEVSQFLNKEKINYNDFLKVEKYINKQLLSFRNQIDKVSMLFYKDVKLDKWNTVNNFNNNN